MCLKLAIQVKLINVLLLTQVGLCICSFAEFKPCYPEGGEVVGERLTQCKLTQYLAHHWGLLEPMA